MNSCPNTWKHENDSLVALSKYLMSNLKPGADPAVVKDFMKVVWRLISFETLLIYKPQRKVVRAEADRKIHTILGAK